MAKDEGGGNWGYNGAVKDEAALLERFGAITEAAGKLPGFCGYCYTQLTDIEQEQNGLLDEMHQFKLDAAAIKAINDRKETALAFSTVV